jgi:acetyl esterase
MVMMATSSGRPEPRSGPSDPAPPVRGPRRNRPLYDGRARRVDEHRSLVTRALCLVLARPEPVLRLLRDTAPVDREGRVLNRHTQALLALMHRLGSPGDGLSDPADAADPVVARRRFRASTRVAMPVRRDVQVTGRTVPGPPGGPAVPVRIYRQFGAGAGNGGGPGLPAIVYFHGGGWVTGDLDSHDAFCRLLAVASRCVVVSVAYRLAPEHPFPAAVDDCLAATAWVQGHHTELAVAPGQVGVMGDSAGGNLAAVVALASRTGGRVSPALSPVAAQGLIYPVSDVHFDTDSMQSLADGFYLTRSAMEEHRARYLPDPGDWDDPRASPLLAPDLTGAPPALVVTAGFDPLRDDGERYAAALARAGVDVEYRCCDDQIHGFLGMGILPDSWNLATEVSEAMGRLLRRSMRAGLRG